MQDILKEAIADAKTVRDTALKNAKLALEEAFTPTIQRMLSNKISEELDDEESMDEPLPEEEPLPDEGLGEDPMGEFPEEEEDPMAEMEGMDDEFGMEDDLDEDFELDEIIAELDAGLEEDLDEDFDIDEGRGYDPDLGSLQEEDEFGADDELELESFLSEMDDEYGEDEPEPAMESTNQTLALENKRLKSDLKEAYEAIQFLRDRMNEVSLVNGKLLYSNKIFRGFEMNEAQKLKVLEAFDRAGTTREVKLVYTTIVESMSKAKRKKKVQIKESRGSASLASGRTTTGKREIISENSTVRRFRELAGMVDPYENR